MCYKARMAVGENLVQIFPVKFVVGGGAKPESEILSNLRSKVTKPKFHFAQKANLKSNSRNRGLS